MKRIFLWGLTVSILASSTPMQAMDAAGTMVKRASEVVRRMPKERRYALAAAGAGVGLGLVLGAVWQTMRAKSLSKRITKVEEVPEPAAPPTLKPTQAKMPSQFKHKEIVIGGKTISFFAGSDDMVSTPVTRACEKTDSLPEFLNELFVAGEYQRDTSSLGFTLPDERLNKRFTTMHVMARFYGDRLCLYYIPLNGGVDSPFGRAFSEGAMHLHLIQHGVPFFPLEKVLPAPPVALPGEEEGTWVTQFTDAFGDFSELTEGQSELFTTLKDNREEVVSKDFFNLGSLSLYGGPNGGQVTRLSRVIEGDKQASFHLNLACHTDTSLRNVVGAGWLEDFLADCTNVVVHDSTCTSLGLIQESLSAVKTISEYDNAGLALQDLPSTVERVDSGGRVLMFEKGSELPPVQRLLQPLGNDLFSSIEGCGGLRVDTPCAFVEEEFSDAVATPAVLDAMAYEATLHDKAIGIVPLNAATSRYIAKRCDIFEQLLARTLDQWRADEGNVGTFLKKAVPSGSSFTEVSLDDKAAILDKALFIALSSGDNEEILPLRLFFPLKEGFHDPRTEKRINVGTEACPRWSTFKPEGNPAWFYRLYALGVLHRLTAEGRLSSVFPSGFDLDKRLFMCIGLLVKAPTSAGEQAILRGLQEISSRFKHLITVTMAPRHATL